MKGVFIAYNQAHNEQVLEQIKLTLLKGYTLWEEVAGVGSQDGEPHLGSHAWPTLNSAMLLFAEDSKVAELKKRLELVDQDNPALGLRVFTWDIDK